MADCYECVHSEVKGGKLKCSRYNEDVSGRSHVCGRFADYKTAQICEDCDYYEFGAFSRWNSNGRCKLTGRKRKDDDIACENFFR